MNYELANMPWAAQGVHGRTVCHRVIPFPDIQLVFPATLGYEKPGPVFLFVVAANCAALQVHLFKHKLGSEILESKCASNHPGAPMRDLSPEIEGVFVSTGKAVPPGWQYCRRAVIVAWCMDARLRFFE